jgi:hypothetical protein
MCRILNPGNIESDENLVFIISKNISSNFSLIEIDEN